jgi:hypothetical protein
MWEACAQEHNRNSMEKEEKRIPWNLIMHHHDSNTEFARYDSFGERS